MKRNQWIALRRQLVEQLLAWVEEKLLPWVHRECYALEPFESRIGNWTVRVTEPSAPKLEQRIDHVVAMVDQLFRNAAIDDVTKQWRTIRPKRKRVRLWMTDKMEWDDE